MQQRGVAVLSTLLLLLASPLAGAAGSSFSLVAYSFTLPDGGTPVPGSTGVLAITLRYSGSSPAVEPVACLSLPEGFSLPAGELACKPLANSTGTTLSELKPGGLGYVSYRVSVSGNVTPGYYYAVLAVEYTVNGSRVAESLEVPLRVAEPPTPQLRVSAYFSPVGYPGSSSAELRVAVENLGPASVAGGVIRLTLPEGFRPRNLSLQLPPVPSGASATVSAGVAIAPDTRPGVYVFNYTVEGAASYAGASYNFTAHGSASVEVSPPPSISIKLLDYGLAPLPWNGSQGARLYIVLANMEPGLTVDAVYAWFSLGDGAVFYNGSVVGVDYSTTPIGYGNTATLTSPPIRLIRGNVSARVKLLVHGRLSGGPDFWALKTLEIRAEPPEPPAGLELVRAYWSPSPVYPGSTSSLTVELLVNNSGGSLSSLSAKLVLPEGFHPRTLYASLRGVAGPGSVARLVFQDISVEAKPGVYAASLVLYASYSVEGGGFYTVNTSIPILLRVDEPPGQSPVRLVYAGWGSGVGYSEMVGASIRVLLQAARPGVRVEKLVAWLEPGPGLWVGGWNTSVVGPASYGDVLELVFHDVSVHASPPGVAAVLHVSALVDQDGSRYWFNGSIPLLLRLEPLPRLVLLDSWLEGVGPADAAYTATPVLLVYNPNPGLTVEQVVARVLGVSGGRIAGNPTVVVDRADIGPGETARVRLALVSLEEPSAVVRVAVRGTARLSDGARTSVVLEANASVGLPGGQKVLGLVWASTLCQGEPCLLYAGQRGVELSLRLVSRVPFQLTSIEPSVEAPPGFSFESISGTCLSGVAPGGQCSLSLRLNVSKAVRPGVYTIRLRLGYSYARSGGVYGGTETLEIPVRVHSALAGAPRLLAVAYWAGGRVYAWSGVSRLVVALVNEGRETVYGVAVSLKPLNSSVVVAGGEWRVCSSALAPGSSCALEFPVDLQEVGPGRLAFIVAVNYTRRAWGLNEPVSVTSRVSVPVDPPPRTGLLVVWAGWRNGLPVYPGSRNATLVVRLANQWPHSVSGIVLRVEMPEGFQPRVLRGYIPGPVPAYAAAEASFTVSVLNTTRPGVYTARLKASYVVGVEGVTREQHYSANFNVTVDSPDNVFEIVEAYWEGEPPSKGTVGARLHLVLRVNPDPAARGVVAELRGEGLVWSKTGTGLVRVPVRAEQQLYPALALASLAASSGGGGSQLSGLEQLLGGSGGEGEGFSGESGGSLAAQGSIVDLVVEANIAGGGDVAVQVRLSWIDAWGSIVYSSWKRVVLEVPGRPGWLSAWFTPVRVKPVNGLANTSLVVVNNGDATAFDAEAVVAPRVPVLSPLQPRVRLGELAPGKKSVVPLSFAYNPTASSLWGGDGQAKYSAVPVTVAVIYHDQWGNTYTYNTTLTIVVEPIIDVTVEELRAELRNNTLTVGGVVVNRGLATARSVEVVVESSGRKASTFLGDLDPATQTAFRVDLEAASRGPVRVTVSYLDDYGRRLTVNYTVPVTEAPGLTGPRMAASRAETGGGPGTWKLLAPVTVMVAAFLAASYLLIRRHLSGIGVARGGL